MTDNKQCEASKQKDQKPDEPKKLKPCCACPETKRVRDECIVLNGEEKCGDLIEAHKKCMRDLGFNAMMSSRPGIQRLNLKRGTNALSDLVSRMGEQLKYSEETTSTLMHSSATIRDTDEQFTTMGATIKSGGKLLSKYGRRETTDKILIIFALIFYLGTVLYILRKRTSPDLF